VCSSDLRGTGKSTWLGQAFPGALRLDLLAPEVLRSDLKALQAFSED
jgi:hypothetical protein